MSTPPTVVLVHGACHGSPAYMRPLIGWLTHYGIPTIPTTCPSDNCVPATLGMYDDARYVREVVSKEIDAGKDVLVLMHSYGGVVGTEACKGLGKKEREAKGLKGGVVHLYYLSAFMLPEGESLASALQAKPDLVKPAATIHDDGRGTFEDPIPVLYNDLLPHAAAYWASHLHHYTLQDNLDTLTHSTWKDIPTTYVRCTLDNAIPITFQDSFVETVKAAGVDVKVETLKSAHSPFLNMPALVAESVVRAAGVRVEG